MSTNDNLANLLDMDLDDIADLPEFVVPPAGAYTARIKSIQAKNISDLTGVEAKFELLSTLELVDTTATPVANGTECSVFFNTSNEWGAGDLKNLLRPLAVHTGVTGVRGIMEVSAGVEVMIVTKVQTGKKGTASEDKQYLKIVKLEVL